jgi:hypothetical protein
VIQLVSHTHRYVFRRRTVTAKTGPRNPFSATRSPENQDNPNNRFWDALRKAYDGEVGGLLGQAICVRRSVMPIQAQEFAQSRRIPVVLKDRLMSGLRSLLYPNEPASLEQLHELAKARTAGRA